MALHLLIKENQIKFSFAPPQHVFLSDETEGAAPAFSLQGPLNNALFQIPRQLTTPLILHSCYSIPGTGLEPMVSPARAPWLTVSPVRWCLCCPPDGQVSRGPHLSCSARSQHPEAPGCDGWGSHTGRRRAPWDLILFDYKVWFPLMVTAPAVRDESESGPKATAKVASVA